MAKPTKSSPVAKMLRLLEIFKIFLFLMSLYNNHPSQEGYNQTTFI